MTHLEKPVMRNILQLIPGYDPDATAGDCTFDDAAAEHVIGFFETALTHVKGRWAGQPFLLEPWQKSMLANAFGWKRPDKTRRYREVFVFVPRKDGKSLMGAGVGVYVLFCDGEPGAEIYSAAAERDQASLIWGMARQQVQNNPELHKACRIYTASRAIVIEKMGSSYKPISADANTKHGYNVHCAIIDELHAQKTPELVDVLITATGARAQPMIWHFTTSDYDRPSVCNTKYDYACKVRDGIIDDPAFLPVIFEADREDDWIDPKTWAKANPNLGVSVSMEYLERECKRAQENPVYENTFKRLHLNIRTEQAVRWIPMDVWDACAGGDDPVAWRERMMTELEGRHCYAGMDLSATTDLSALVFFFPAVEDEDLPAVLLPFFWIPEDRAVEREKRDRVPYATWARQGWIETTPGNVIDYAFIRRRVNELGQQFAIQEIAYDPWNGTQLALELAEEDGFEMVQYRQGFISMNEPSKELMVRLSAGRLEHGGNPVLRWNASNASVTTDAAENIKPSKQHSPEKIDGIVATVMALGRSMVSDEGGTSVYDDGDSLML